MASEFIANSEMLVQMLDNMPRKESIRNITDQAFKISSRFKMVSDQFQQYNKDVKGYKDSIDQLLLKRAEIRGKGDESNPANQEQ